MPTVTPVLYGFYSQAGPSPLELGPKLEESRPTPFNPIGFLTRLVFGTVAGFYFFVLPIYMWVKNLLWPKNARGF